MNDKICRGTVSRNIWVDFLIFHLASSRRSFRWGSPGKGYLEKVIVIAIAFVFACACACVAGENQA